MWTWWRGRGEGIASPRGIQNRLTLETIKRGRESRQTRRKRNRNGEGLNVMETMETRDGGERIACTGHPKPPTAVALIRGRDNKPSARAWEIVVLRGMLYIRGGCAYCSMPASTTARTKLAAAPASQTTPLSTVERCRQS